MGLLAKREAHKAEVPKDSEKRAPAKSFFDAPAEARQSGYKDPEQGWQTDVDTRINPNLELQPEIAAPDAHAQSTKRTAEIAAQGFVDVQKGEHWLHPRESRRMNAGDFSTHSWRQRTFSEKERAERKEAQERKAWKGFMWLLSAGSGSNT